MGCWLSLSDDSDEAQRDRKRLEQEPFSSTKQAAPDFRSISHDDNSSVSVSTSVSVSLSTDSEIENNNSRYGDKARVGEKHVERRSIKEQPRKSVKYEPSKTPTHSSSRKKQHIDPKNISKFDDQNGSRSNSFSVSLSSSELSASSENEIDIKKHEILKTRDIYEEKERLGRQPGFQKDDKSVTSKQLSTKPTTKPTAKLSAKPTAKPIAQTLPKNFKLSQARQAFDQPKHENMPPKNTKPITKTSHPRRKVSGHIASRASLFNQKNESKPKTRPVSKTLKPGQFGTRPKCPLCGKTAYQAESVEYNKVYYHKICFKCAQCRLKLSVHSICPADGKFYCKRCFNAVKIAKGNETSTKRVTYTAASDVIVSNTLQDGQSVKDRYIQEYSVNMHRRSENREHGIKEHRMSNVVKIDKAKKDESAKLIEKILKDKQTRGLENQLKITAGDGENSDDEKLSEHEMENSDIVKQEFDLPKRPQRKRRPAKKKKAKQPATLNLNNNAGEFKKLTPSQFDEKTQEIENLINGGKMEVLSLTNCGLGNNFIEKLVPSLCENTTIKELNLESNNFSGPAYSYLSTLLLNNKTLEVLKLRNQTMRPGHKAQLEFLGALEKNTTLKTLGFDFTQKHQNDLKQKYLNRNLDLRRKERNLKKQEQT